MKIVIGTATFFLFFSCALFSQTKTASLPTKLNPQVQALAREGKIDEAIVLAERDLELLNTSAATKSKDFVAALLNLGTLKRMRVERAYKQVSIEKPDNKKWQRIKEIEKEADETESLLRQVINIHEMELKTETPQLASAMSELAWMLQNTRRPTEQKALSERSVEVESLLQRSLKIRQSLLGEKNNLVLKAMSDLAEFYFLQTNFEKSLPLLQNYINIAPKTLGENNIKLVPVLQLYAANLMTTDYQAEAEEICQRISSITKKPEDVPKTNLILNERAVNLAPVRHPNALARIDSSSISDVFAREIREGNGFPKAIVTSVLPVYIVVDEQGKVIEAKAEVEDESLRKAAEKAALKSSFKPFVFDGKARKMRGALNYHFVMVEKKR